MKKFLRFIILFSFFVIFLFSCQEKSKQHIDNSSDFRGQLLILNTLSENISAFDGETIKNNLAAADAGANSILQDGNNILVINSLSNSFSVYDKYLKLIYEVSTGASTNPYDGAILDNTLYISSFLKDEILLFRKKSGHWELEKSIPINNKPSCDDSDEKGKAAPMGVATDNVKIYVAIPNLNSEYVACGSGGVYMGKEDQWSMIQLHGRDTVNVVNLGKTLAFLSAGDYIQGEGFKGNGEIELYDPFHSEITKEIEIKGAPYSVTGPIGGYYFVSDAVAGDVIVYDTSWNFVKKIVVSNNSIGMVSAIEIFKNRVMGLEFNSNTLFVINPGNLNVIARFTTGDGPIYEKVFRRR